MSNVVLYLCPSVDNTGTPDPDQCFVIAYDPNSVEPHSVVFYGTESACSAFLVLTRVDDATRHRIRDGMTQLGRASFGDTLPF
jgi:hypothetical protein